MEIDIELLAENNYRKLKRIGTEMFLFDIDKIENYIAHLEHIYKFSGFYKNRYDILSFVIGETLNWYRSELRKEFF